MLPFLSLHAIAAQRGDGLRPELLVAFRHSISATVDRAVSESGRSRAGGAVELAMDRNTSERTVLDRAVRDVPSHEKLD
jgi:hypothetical protein